MNLFQQTLRELDAIFYATFPAAALQLKFDEQHNAHDCDYDDYDYDDVPPLVHAYHPPPPPSPPDNRPAALALSHAHRQAHAQAQEAQVQAMRLGPLPPTKEPLQKKPPLACLFCRGRKIACGSPLPGSPDMTCNQCRNRSLHCNYPSESRRGKRAKKSVDTDPVSPPTKPL